MLLREKQSVEPWIGYSSYFKVLNFEVYLTVPMQAPSRLCWKWSSTPVAFILCAPWMSICCHLGPCFRSPLSALSRSRKWRRCRENPCASWWDAKGHPVSLIFDKLGMGTGCKCLHNDCTAITCDWDICGWLSVTFWHWQSESRDTSRATTMKWYCHNVDMLKR